jgi:5-methylcytosine-specific restriction protein A
MGRFNAKKILVVDMETGSYLKERTGHEIFNLKSSPVDEKFYGYCPPRDGINIKHFGADKGAEYIDGVLVVYVKKKENSNNREVIAFCPRARVFRNRQSGEGLCRTFKDKKDNKDVIASYSIKSDSLYSLEGRSNKFEIKVEGNTAYMFRASRFYGGTYPELDKKIIAYIESILESKEILDDDSEEQEEIQRAEPATTNEIKGSAGKPLNIVMGSQGKTIAKDSRISKAALKEANYTCQIDSTHETFMTASEEPYMEGHHLIPCTTTNSEIFYDKYNRNIDCFENIVCICPSCHRAVHFGNENTKAEKIKVLFAKQGEKLRRVGIAITEEDLFKLYKI